MFSDLSAPSLVELKLESWEGRLPKESNEAYHARSEYLSSSDIKHMLESPRHFKRLCLEKTELKRDKNEAFDLGTCAHECFLEQDTNNFVAGPDVDRRTKAGKEEYAAFLEANPGKRIISLDQYDRLLKMFDVIASNEIAENLVSEDGALIEQGFFYPDTATGLKCKFRADILNVRAGYIADYKTAIKASPHEFAKAVARYHHHLSAAHYIVGVHRIFGVWLKNYYFIVQEKEDPFAVAIYEMDKADIERSLDLRAHIMRKIAECMKSNSWPDWSSNILKLSIPGYGFEFKEVQ